MSEQYQVSVIVPVFNAERYIAEAIDSILAQSTPAMEIVTIDDGSSDNSATILKRYGSKLRYHYQANSGSSVARNNGVAMTRGQMLAFLDADDLWVARKLAIQLAAFRENPSLDLVWGHVVEFTGSPPLAGESVTPVPGHHPGTMLIRRAVFDRVGGFSETYQQAEVLEWMTRLMQQDVNCLMLPDVLMYRRIHDANKGIANPGANLQYLQILKKHLDRKRAD